MEQPYTRKLVTIQQITAITDTELPLEHTECLQQKLETGPRLSIIN